MMRKPQLTIIFFVFYCYMFAAAIGCCSAASCQVGIALKPATPAELVLPYLQQGLLDLVSNTGGGCYDRTGPGVKERRQGEDKRGVHRSIGRGRCRCCPTCSRGCWIWGATEKCRQRECMHIHACPRLYACLCMRTHECSWRVCGGCTNT